MKDKNVVLTIRTARDDGEWTRLMWTTPDLSSDGKQAIVESGYQFANRLDFWNAIGESPSNAAALRGKSFVGRAYQRESRPGQWLIDPKSLFDADVLTQAPAKRSIPAQVVKPAPAPTPAPNPAPATLQHNPLQALGAFVAAMPSTPTAPQPAVPPPAAVVPARSAASIASEKGRDTRALKEIQALVIKSLLDDDHTERKSRLEKSDPEIIKLLKSFSSLMDDRLGN